MLDDDVIFLHIHILFNWNSISARSRDKGQVGGGDGVKTGRWTTWKESCVRNNSKFSSLEVPNELSQKNARD